MKKVLGIVFLMVGISFSGFSQSQEETVSFKTSAICKMCKKRIENDLSLAKGVKSANLNLDDKTVTVVYNSSKTNPEKLKKNISKIGYDADEVAARPKAHDRLPECCQKTAEAHKD